MSDSHRKHNRFDLPEADVFVHAGDFSNHGGGVEEFAVWYWRLPYKHKLLVLGNHEGKDAVAQRPPEVWRRMFGPTLLDNAACALNVNGEDLIVFGAPFGVVDFSNAPRTTALMVTHEPPFGILDRKIGSEPLEAAVRDVGPKLHLFGHVHAAGGRSETHGTTLYVNAATRAVLVDLNESAAVQRVIRPRSSVMDTDRG